MSDQQVFGVLCDRFRSGMVDDAILVLIQDGQIYEPQRNGYMNYNELGWYKVSYDDDDDDDDGESDDAEEWETDSDTNEAV